MEKDLCELTLIKNKRPVMLQQKKNCANTHNTAVCHDTNHYTLDYKHYSAASTMGTENGQHATWTRAKSTPAPRGAYCLQAPSAIYYRRDGWARWHVKYYLVSGYVRKVVLGCFVVLLTGRQYTVGSDDPNY